MAQLDLEQLSRNIPILEDLGIVFESAADGRSRCSMLVTPRVMTLVGALHGGITLTLADSGMGVAVFTLLRPGEEAAASIELSMRYLRPASAGRVVAECRVIRRSKRLAITEAEVFDEAGELLAVAGGWYYISRSKT